MIVKVINEINYKTTPKRTFQICVAIFLIIERSLRVRGCIYPGCVFDVVAVGAAVEGGSGLCPGELVGLPIVGGWWVCGVACFIVGFFFCPLSVCPIFALVVSGVLGTFSGASGVYFSFCGGPLLWVMSVTPSQSISEDIFFLGTLESQMAVLCCCHACHVASSVSL